MKFEQLIEHVVDIVKRCWPFRIVRQWERGIRIYSGNVTKELTSSNGLRWFRGLHTFVPVIGEIRTHECNWEVIETPPQTLVTNDGKSVTVQFAVTYRVRDLKQYYVSIQNQDHTVLGGVRASAGVIVPQTSWADLPSTLAEAMRASVSKRVRRWGLEVREVMPTTLVDSPTVRLLIDPSTAAASTNGAASEE